MMNRQMSIFDASLQEEEKGPFVLKEQKVRLRLEESPGLYSSEHISSPLDAVNIMARVLKEMDREYLCVVNLNNQNQPLGYSVVGVGDLNSCIVNISNVFKTAILANTSRIVLMHNHPSGTCAEPSNEDLQTTVRVAGAGNLLGIQLLDHVVVSGDDQYSIRTNHPDLFTAQSAEPWLKMTEKQAGRSM